MGDADNKILKFTGINLTDTIQIFKDDICKGTFHAITEEEKDALDFTYRLIKKKAPEKKKLIKVIEGLLVKIYGKTEFKIDFDEIKDKL